MPTQHPWRLSEVTLKQVREINYEVAVLPFGATEPHNMHLPYATDNIEVVEICDRACRHAWERGAKVALLPNIPFGADQNMMTFPMTISLDQSLLNAIVESTAKSLERHGVMKLVVVNGHGGNDFKSGIREVYGRSKVFVCLINWFQMMADEGKKIFEKHDGDHADEMETSLVQAIAPDLVTMSWADDGGCRESRFEAVRQKGVWHPRPWEKLTKNSGCGDPRLATAEKGRKYLKATEERFGKFLVELAGAEMDEDFPFQPRKDNGSKKSGRSSKK